MLYKPQKKGNQGSSGFCRNWFNNDPISEIIDPNISTVTHPADKMGTAAANIVIDAIGSRTEEEAKEITFLNIEVLIRESSKRA